MEIRWHSFKEIIEKSKVDLIVKADPPAPSNPAKPAEPTPVVSTPDEPTPVVPMDKKPATVPYPHVPCHNCENSSSSSSQQSQANGLSYPSSTTSKPIDPSKITIDHVAQKLHRSRYINGNTSLPKDHPHHPNNFFDLPREEQDAHLNNNVLQHLSDDELKVLRKTVTQHSGGALKSAETMLGLPLLPGYDPDILHSRIVDKIMKIMSPNYLSGIEHGNETRQEIEARAAAGEYDKYTPTGKKSKKAAGVPGLFYGGGINTEDNQLTGQDIVNFVQKQNSWGKRTAVHDPKIKELIQTKDAQTDKLQQNNADQKKVEKELAKQAKETGNGGVVIDQETPYSLSELSEIAHNNGYKMSKELSPDGNSFSSISVHSPDGEHNFTVDLKNGGKLSQVKDKMAELLNSKETVDDHPTKQYIGHESSYAELKPRLAVAQKSYDDAREAFQLYEVEPEVHFERISHHASEAGNQIESFFKSLPKELKSQFSQVHASFSDGIENLLQDEGNEEQNKTNQTDISLSQFSNGIKELKKASQMAQSLKVPPDKQNLVFAFVKELTSIIKESEALRSKSSIAPEKREKELSHLFDKMKDNEERRDELEQKSSFHRDQMDELMQHPDVTKYAELKKIKANLDEKKEAILSENTGSVSSVQDGMSNSEGENTGLQSDKVAFEAWQDKQKLGADDEENDDYGGDDEESKPIDEDEVGKFVPHSLDYTNSESLSSASKNILNYMDKNFSPQFIFGSDDKKFSGMQRVASGIIANVVNNKINAPDGNGQTTKGAVKTEQILSGEPSKGINGKGWNRLKEIDPQIIAKYASLTSKFCPHPVSPLDIYENPKGMFSQLIRALHPESDAEVLDKNTIATILGPPDEFSSTIYSALHSVGNQLISSQFSEHTPERKLLDKIGKLNERAQNKKGDEFEYPGDTRRRLARTADYIYGNHYGKVPDGHAGLLHDVRTPVKGQKWVKGTQEYFGKTPDVHDYGESKEEKASVEKEKKEDGLTDDWLKQNSNKSFVIYEPSRNKYVVKI